MHRGKKNGKKREVGENLFMWPPVTLPCYLSFQPGAEQLQRYQQQCTTPVDTNRRQPNRCYCLVDMKCNLRPIWKRYTSELRYSRADGRYNDLRLCNLSEGAGASVPWVTQSAYLPNPAGKTISAILIFQCLFNVAARNI